MNKKLIVCRSIYKVTVREMFDIANGIDYELVNPSLSASPCPKCAAIIIEVTEGDQCHVVCANAECGFCVEYENIYALRTDWNGIKEVKRSRVFAYCGKCDNYHSEATGCVTHHVNLAD